MVIIYHESLLLFKEKHLYGPLTVKTNDGCLLQAKRIRDMLPPLPEGVTSSYIQYLDVIHSLNCRGIQAKVSDISDALALPRPGVTRTIKDMETKGYVKKLASPADGRVTYLSITGKGEELHQKYNEQYFHALASCVKGISEEDALCMIRTIEKFYTIMCERRISIDK